MDEDLELLTTGADAGRDIDARFERRIVMNVPDRHNPKLHRVMELVNADDDLYALWTAANVNAVERLSMTDHGPVHVKIVMNIAVRMLRLLVGRRRPARRRAELRHGRHTTRRSSWR